MKPGRDLRPEIMTLLFSLADTLYRRSVLFLGFLFSIVGVKFFSEPPKPNPKVLPWLGLVPEHRILYLPAGVGIVDHRTPEVCGAFVHGVIEGFEVWENTSVMVVEFFRFDTFVSFNKKQ